MKEILHSSATSRARQTRAVCKLKAVVKTVVVGLAFLCSQWVFNSAASGQGQTTTVGIFEFQDASGATLPAAFTQRIARELSRKLNLDHKDFLARRFNAATDAPSLNTMTVEQLGALGKQFGVKFVVRGGLLAAGDGNSNAQSKGVVQLYADIVSVETLSIKSVRAEGNMAENDQALSQAIGQLAESIHQAIVSPMAEPAAPSEPPPTAGSDANRSNDPKDVGAAESDEELQQLIAQAESLIADGSSASGERLTSLSQALAALRAALKSKATLLEEGKETTPADQEVAQQKDKLQASLSALAQSEMSGTPDSAAMQDQPTSPEGKNAEKSEKKNMLARISEYAGETLNIIQKIQEMRAALRSGRESSDQNETSGLDPTGVAPPPTEESTEEISGVVTEMGQPVAGVTVTEPESGVKAETDINGSYALKGVAAGRLAKLVLAKGGKQVGTGQIDLARKSPPIADFELKLQNGAASQPALRILPSTVIAARAKTSDGNGGVVKGTVQDAQGRPVPRALVRIKDLMARTDSEGRYEFRNILPGAAQLIVQRPGLKPRTEMVQVAARKSSESKIQFGAADKIPDVRNQQSLLGRGTGTVLRGAVVDAQKRPLAGAKITAVQQGLAVSVLAGLRGDYLLRDLKPGSYRVLVSKAGFEEMAQPVILRAGEVTPKDFQLTKKDSPFIDRALAARRNNQTLSPRDPGRTDKQVTREGQAPIKAIAGKVTSPAQTRSGSLIGRVSDSKTGKPVSGATVSVQGGRTTKTDEAGNYRVLDLPAGSGRISIIRAGFFEQQRTVRVTAGNSMQENFALVPENANDSRRPQLPVGGAETKRGQLRGRVVDAKTGRPIPAAIVSIAGQRSVASDREGFYTFETLPPGAYQLAVRKSDFVDGIARLVIRSGETTTANLRLNPKPLNRVR